MKSIFSLNAKKPVIYIIAITSNDFASFNFDFVTFSAPQSDCVSWYHSDSNKELPRVA